jgi:hypothetical protein
MELFEQITEKLKKYPEVEFVIKDNMLTVKPVNENGFEVAISIDTDEYTVFYEGWHEHFEDTKEALQCFTFGLSDQCRLKVTYRGKSSYKWTMESLNKDQWQEDSTTGLLFTPFWRRKQIRYFSNSIISQE